MSIDELAAVLYSTMDKVCFENCEKSTGNRFSCPIAESDVEEKYCIECMKHWLESEVAE